MTDGQTDV